MPEYFVDPQSQPPKQPKEPKKQKKRSNWFVKVLMALILFAGFGAGGFYAYYNFVYKKNATSLSASYQDLGTPMESQDKIFQQYSLDIGDNNFFLNQQELEEFETYFQNHLYYGPEFYELNHIVLNDSNVFLESGSAAGLYIPAIKAIFINLSIYNKKYTGTLAILQNKYIYEVMTKTEKFQVLMDVLSHEYGHYLISTYFNNVPDYDANTTILVGKDKDRHNENWNIEYIDRFQKINNYQNTTWATTKQPMSSIITSSNKKYWAISSFYSLNDLYANANYAQNPADNFDLFAYISQNTQASGSSKILPSYIVSGSDLSYLYSQDEIATRLLQQLMQPFEIVDLNSRSFQLSKPKTNYYFAYAEDFLMSTSSLEYNTSTNTLTSDLVFPNYMWGGQYQYLENGQVQTTTLPSHNEDLYKLMLEGMGYGAEISKVWFKNETSTKDGNRIENQDDINYYNPNLIRWSGYTDQKYDYIVAKNKLGQIDPNQSAIQILSDSYFNTTKFWKTDSIFHFFAKKDLNSNWSTDSTGGSAFNSQDFYFPEDISGFSAKYAYVLADYVNPARIAAYDLDLYFASDLNSDGAISADEVSNEQVSSINNFGHNLPTEYVTTYPQGYGASNPNQNYWWIVKNDDGTLDFVATKTIQ